MGIIKDFTERLESRNKALLTQKVAGLMSAFSEPATPPRIASFCDPESKRACITLCASEGCKSGCDGVRQAIEEGLAGMGLDVPVGRMKTGCGGSCSHGPMMGFPRKLFFYVGVKVADVPQIIKETIVGGKLIFPLLSIDSERSYRSDVFYDKHTGMLAGIDEKVCMVDVGKYFLRFTEEISCGKCVPCRIGMKRALEGVTRISEGTGTDEDLEQLRVLCDIMEQTPNCSFANTNIRPLLSAITYFKDEFRTHIDNKTCTAGVCKDLVELQRKLAVRERLSKSK